MDEGWFAPSYALFFASAGETLILLLQSKKKLRTDSLFYGRPGNSGASGSDGETWRLFSVRRGGQFVGRKFTEKRTAFRRNACYELLQKHQVSLQDTDASVLIFYPPGLPPERNKGKGTPVGFSCTCFLPLCGIFAPLFLLQSKGGSLQKPGGFQSAAAGVNRWKAGKKSLLHDPERGACETPLQQVFFFERNAVFL